MNYRTSFLTFKKRIFLKGFYLVPCQQGSILIVPKGGYMISKAVIVYVCSICNGDVKSQALQSNLGITVWANVRDSLTMSTLF